MKYLILLIPVILMSSCSSTKRIEKTKDGVEFYIYHAPLKQVNDSTYIYVK